METNLVKADITITSANAARAAIPARSASFWPRRFPILKCSNKMRCAWRAGGEIHRTEEAIPREKGARKTVPAEITKIDWLASETGPKLQWKVSVARTILYLMIALTGMKPAWVAPRPKAVNQFVLCRTVQGGKGCQDCWSFPKKTAAIPDEVVHGHHEWGKEQI